MAAMLTGSEQNWRSFTRSVLSMMTEILLKQAMVGIWGISAAPLVELSVVVRLPPRGRLFRLQRRTSILRPGDLRGRGANTSLRGLFTAGSLSLAKEATSRIGVGNLYRLMRGYAEGGYVGGAGSPAQMRRVEGINFNQNNHVVIQNDGINGQAGPQMLKAVYDMARKGAQDELRLQLRDGGMLSRSRRWEQLRRESEPDVGWAVVGAGGVGIAALRDKNFNFIASLTQEAQPVEVSSAGVKHFSTAVLYGR